MLSAMKTNISEQEIRVMEVGKNLDCFFYKMILEQSYELRWKKFYKYLADESSK